MRVAVDGTPLCYSLTGIGQYTRSLLDALAKARPSWDFVVLSPYQPQDPLHLPNVHHDLHQSKALRSPRLGWRGWWFDVVLPEVLRNLEADVFWGAAGLVPFRLAGVPVAMTIYDYVPEKFPETMTRIARWYRKWNMRYWLPRADWLLPISQSVFDETRVLHGITASAVLHPGVDVIFRDFSDVTEIAGRPYFIVLGTLEPRKNISALLKVVQRLVAEGAWPPDLSVKIVGGRGWLDDGMHSRSNPLESLGIVDRLGYVPREVLPALLAGAEALLMPSLYEGFGMPVAEALAVGCPVVCSDIPPFREIIENGQGVFHGTSEEAMYAAFRALLQDWKPRSIPRPGRGAQPRFLWEYSAQQFLDCLEHQTGRLRGA
jgi:glycosyltransferase involved in cell wall biosynthesis